MILKSCLFFIFLTFSVYADNFILLEGHLSKEKIDLAKNQLNQGLHVIAVNSQSGDLNEVLSFARMMYKLKKEKKADFTVYISENAIGPAAIIPFLADKLDISLFVSWGDIPFGSDEAQANLLTPQVLSLISGPRAETLKSLVYPMIDKEAKFEGKVPGQTLVLNNFQIKELGLVNSQVEPEIFQSEYKVPEPLVTQSPLEESLKQHIRFNPDGQNKVGRIVIDDRSSGISQATWVYVKNALDYYKKERPIFVILELNTPGGEVFAAQKISDALKELDTQEGIPVVSYINNWAISAGAMLAYSTRYIATVKDGSMGAAEPVIQGEGGKMESVSEKVNSAIRTDFMSRASFFDRNPYIAEAMVDKDVILVLRHGKVIKLDSESQIRTGADKDIIVSPKGKLLTLSAPEMIEYKVADFILSPSKLEKKESLLFTYPYFDKIPNLVIDTYQMDWKTRFFVWLTNPVVSSLLLLGVMVGFYMEFSTPGFGLPGTVAITCLFLLLLASFSLELAGWLEVILLFTGLAILLIEFFVLPTFGLLGFIGFIFFLMGLLGLMIPGIGQFQFDLDTKSVNAAGQVVLERLAWFSATFVISLGIISLLARYVMPNFSGFRKFVLEGHEQTGYTSADDPSSYPLAGASGIVVSTLRPSGKIDVDGKYYDAMSTGGFIEKGERVEVLRIEGSQVIVNKDYREKT